MAAENSPDRSAQEFTYTRSFDAPRKLVFDCWSKPEHLARWWGPKGFGLTVAKLEFRPGGVFHYSMQPPKGDPIWGRFTYREIVAPERIVFVNAFSDAQGGLGVNPWMPEWPKETLNTVAFTEQGGKTTISLRAGPIDATEEQWTMFAEAHPSMNGGFGGTYDKLDALLATL